jgi:hypothetical protein
MVTLPWLPWLLYLDVREGRVQVTFDGYHDAFWNGQQHINVYHVIMITAVTVHGQLGG